MKKWICRATCSSILATTALALPLSILAAVKTHEHHCSKQTFGTPDKQDLPFGCAPRCNPPNHVHYLRDNFSYFYDIVTQNSPKSTANRDFNFRGLMAFSGEINMHLYYTNRDGGVGVPGSNYGAGVRPWFDMYEHNLFGGINNMNLFVDTAINDWLLAHIDLAYVNADPKTRTYNHWNGDTGSVYRSAAAFKVNQGYLLFSNPAMTPLYFKVGKFNEPFGDYQPFPMIPSLTQLISETRTGGIILGAAFENGLYASAQWTMAEESLEPRSNNEYGVPVSPDNRDRNWGFKIGFRDCVMDSLFIHANLSYLDDMRDVTYLLEGIDDYNVALREYRLFAWLNGNTFIRMRKAAGLSLHGEIDYHGFGLTVDYVKALAGLNPGDIEFNPAPGDNNIRIGDEKDSMIAAWNFTGHACFNLWCCPARLELSYQGACDADVYGLVRRNFSDGIGRYNRRGNILPCDRFAASYRMQVMPYFGVAVQWVHDRDWDEDHDGTGDCSDMGVLRLHAEF